MSSGLVGRPRLTRYFLSTLNFSSPCFLFNVGSWSSGGSFLVSFNRFSSWYRMSWITGEFWLSISVTVNKSIKVHSVTKASNMNLQFDFIRRVRRGWQANSFCVNVVCFLFPLPFKNLLVFLVLFSLSSKTMVAPRFCSYDWDRNWVLPNELVLLWPNRALRLGMS